LTGENGSYPDESYGQVVVTDLFSVELCPGDYVTVSASRYPFPGVLPLDRKSKDWIDSISRTLNWNSRQRQKAFKEWKS